MNGHHKINYLEIPVKNIQKTKTFFPRHLTGHLWIMARTIAASAMKVLMADSLNPT
jgi:hypothetical protein